MCSRSSPETVDLLRFESLVAEARKADPEGASELLREALGLWRGPAAGRVRGEPFAQAEAARLDDLRLAALEERIEADLALGRHGERDRRARGGDRRAPVSGAAARPADAGALPLGQAGGSARGLPQRTCRARRARDRAERRAAPAREGDSRSGRDARSRGSRARRRRRRCCRGRSSRRRRSRSSAARASWRRCARCSSVPRRARGASSCSRARPAAARRGSCASSRSRRSATACSSSTASSSATITVPFQPVREWLEFLLRVCDPETLEECLGERRRGAVAPRARVRRARRRRRAERPRARRDRSATCCRARSTELLLRLSRLRPLLLVADDLHWADSGTLQLLASAGADGAGSADGRRGCVS